MKLCQTCGQLLAEEISACPSCGSKVVEGRRRIDDYRIEKVLHEGYSSILCKGTKDGTAEPVMIRIFTAQSGVDEKIAGRLKKELEELKKLPEDYFVRHLDIRKSSDGFWYRVSEWIDSENWSTLLSSGCLQDYTVAFKLFYRIASILEGLHRIGHFIPHLIIDDIMVIKEAPGELKVKIDYKLSRFLDPKMDRPGPELKKLLACHPDISNRRPLDFRSDIWSLGKIFIEILSVDFDTTDFLAKIDSLPLPREVAVLFKIMLAQDPDLRPRSMAEVAKVLSRVKEKQIKAAKRNHSELRSAPVKQIKGMRKRLTVLLVMVAVLGLLTAGLAWYYFSSKRTDSSAILLEFANRYAASVAFIMVDYRLLDENSVAYQNRTEGTAFLIDREGYLLTSRHVACPWLEDSNLYVIINMLRQSQRPLRLEYRIFLWFEGERAFNRLPSFSDSASLEDIYFLDSSFSSGGNRPLIIAGVARSPVKTWQLVKSPLKDDFAVLKISPVPEGLQPLPLDPHMDPQKIARLSPVITLGFPLGSQTQEATVNVSVTQGHVRRTFENMLQVDTSIHSGNSGGPVMDIRGKVIGIASGVAIGWALGPVPVATPLSDIGMILPITKAVKFVQDLKAGQTKWNGVIDLSIEEKLKEIKAAAKQGKWAEAKIMADKQLRISFDPALLTAAAMIRFCEGDRRGARNLFEKTLSIDEEDIRAKLMLFIIDWLSGRSLENAYRGELLALDWRSTGEFWGYLAKMLEGHVPAGSAVSEGYSAAEKGWMQYIDGLMRLEAADLRASEALLKNALLLADSDDWLFFIALAELKNVQHQRLESLPEKHDRAAYQAEIKAFTETSQKKQALQAAQRERLAPLIAQLKQEALSPKEKKGVLEQILNSERNNGETLSALAFYSAMNAEWADALEYSRTFLEIKGRENAGQLSVGLLEAEVLFHMARKAESEGRLAAYHRRTKDPWYQDLSAVLLGRRSEGSLSEKAEENPLNLLTWHAALGFWAEGSGDKSKALRHYKEALGSYMDTRIEYEFARERIRRLRNDPE